MWLTELMSGIAECQVMLVRNDELVDWCLRCREDVLHNFGRRVDFLLQGFAFTLGMLRLKLGMRRFGEDG